MEKDEMVAMYGGVKEYIDFLFDSSKERFKGKSRDDKEFRRSVCWNILGDYTNDFLSEESLIACSEYLGISKNDLDLNLVRKIKDTAKKMREYGEKDDIRLACLELHKLVALKEKYYEWAKCESEED